MPGKNKGGPVYTSDHRSWMQGTSKSNTFHFFKFAYDCMAHVEWAFPLHNYFKRDSDGPVRLVSRKMWQDLRLWGTPVQFSFKWGVQQVLGSLTQGAGTFTISSNITHVGKQWPGAQPRWNTEYKRWVIEQQMEHLVAIKEAVASFPRLRLRATHKLSGVAHPLAEWALLPTTADSLPVATVVADGDDDDEISSGGSLSDSGASSADSGDEAAPCS